MKYFILPLIALTLTIYSCESKKDGTVPMSTDSTIKTDSIVSSEDSSKISLDWDGTYEGVLPCADCEGIKTTIVLNEDNSYQLSSEYIGHEDVFKESGKFTWSTNGNEISIKLKDGEIINYTVGEGQLIQLDQEGKKITGALADKYILKKK